MELTTQQKDVLAQINQMGSNDVAIATAAATEYAKAVQVPLREQILTGDNISNIFTPEDYRDGKEPKFPLDVLRPGDEAQHVAYVIPDEGRIAEKRVESDYVVVPTFRIANGIDAKSTHLRDAKFPMAARMMEILEGGFIAKKNDEGWQTVLSAARGRGLVVSDPNAVAGQFTPRLITALSTIMRRSGGGNSGSKNRSKLTDIYMSPEAHMDIRSWNIVEIPETARTTIYNDAGNSDTINVYGVNLHALDEFGEGQEYQNYFITTLGGSMAASDLEIVIALDRQRNDSFVMPVREDLLVNEDLTAHRHQLVSFYATMELGFGVLDARRVLVGSL